MHVVAVVRARRAAVVSAACNVAIVPLRDTTSWLEKRIAPRMLGRASARDMAD